MTWVEHLLRCSLSSLVVLGTSLRSLARHRVVVSALRHRFLRLLTDRPHPPHPWIAPAVCGVAADQMPLAGPCVQPACSCAASYWVAWSALLGLLRRSHFPRVPVGLRPEVSVGQWAPSRRRASRALLRTHLPQVPVGLRPEVSLGQLPLMLPLVSLPPRGLAAAGGVSAAPALSTVLEQPSWHHSLSARERETPFWNCCPVLLTELTGRWPVLQTSYDSWGPGPPRIARYLPPLAPGRGWRGDVGSGRPPGDRESSGVGLWPMLESAFRRRVP